MSKLIYIAFLGLIIGCVPLNKYNELQNNYIKSQEESASSKSSALDYENRLKELETQLKLAENSLDKLKKDTLQLSHDFDVLSVEYDKLGETNKFLESQYSKLQYKGSREAAKMIQDLEGTRLELQRKEDRLNELEKELNERARILDEKEARIKELEDIIAKKDAAVQALKAKISEALLGFKDKGLTVEEKNGKIYVSMEAKLLFASGKTNVQDEGKLALIDLAKVLETQKDINIIVEGHTDIDPLSSENHPIDNWELSVLRATSVSKIMLENSAMNPKTITAAGRSEFFPIDPSNKSKNRRIEIIITPDLNELFELISNK